MSSEKERELVLVTGADGQIGQAVCLLLRAQGLPLLATDIAPVDSRVREAGFRDFMRCDLTSQENVQRLFESESLSGRLYTLPLFYPRLPWRILWPPRQ